MDSPRYFWADSATALPTVSVLPPAAKGTIRLRDFLGKSSFVSVDADF
jgi:hypothetical protein